LHEIYVHHKNSIYYPHRWFTNSHNPTKYHWPPFMKGLS
jgi:hypothetical protein